MSAYPTATTALLMLLEKLTAQALKLDPGTRAALAKLAGKSLAIHISQPEQSVYMLFSPTGITLASSAQERATTSLSGSAADLFHLLTGSQHSLYQSGVSLRGSTALLAELQTIAGNIELDWEEALSQVIGVVPAHTLAESLRRGAHWCRARSASGSRLTGEYLTEELATVVGRHELACFSSDVDTLRLRLDRLEARVTHVRNSARSGSPAPHDDKEH